MGVRHIAGTTVLTRMPARANSDAAHALRPRSGHLLVEYAMDSPSWISVFTSLAPAATKRRAPAFPMPLGVPVIMATFPLRLVIQLSLWTLLNQKRNGRPTTALRDESGLGASFTHRSYRPE